MYMYIVTFHVIYYAHMTWALYIILGIVALGGIWTAWTYNRFVRLQNRTEEAWADIDVQLKRRYDLIPNLIETVKGYAQHEQETFSKVTEMRTAAMEADDPKAREEKENQLTEALKSLFAVSENYPDLKANENFLELQRELSDTENKIQAARRFYNTNVRDLNTKLDTFPAGTLGRALGFNERSYFELEEEAAREPVQVNF